MSRGKRKRLRNLVEKGKQFATKFKDSYQHGKAGIKDAVGAVYDLGGSYQDFKSGKLLSGVQGAKRALGKAKQAGHHVIKAVTGWTSENDKRWYIKYVNIQPAYNPNRQMAPRFSKDVTKFGAWGSIGKFIVTDMKWADFTNSYMWKHMTTNSYQLLRIMLKSNLPYSQDTVSAYLCNAITLAVAAKMKERDIAWRNYSDPDTFNFAELYKQRPKVRGGYGIVETVVPDELSDENWAITISNYDRLRQLVSTSVRLAPSLVQFISHYFATVFTDSDDGYNQQYFINNMHEMPYVTKTTDGFETQLLDLSELTVAELTELVSNLSVDYGMVIADLVNSEQCVPLCLDDMSNYSYVAVFDDSYHQAMINAYTSSAGVTDKGYVRLDAMPKVDDDLTQYIFLGGVQNSDSNDQGYVPAITVQSQTLIVDSDNDIEWPAGFDQIQAASFTQDGAFGIQISSDISIDAYADLSGTVQASGSQTATFNIINGQSITLPATGGSMSVKVARTTGNFNVGSYVITPAGSSWRVQALKQGSIPFAGRKYAYLLSPLVSQSPQGTAPGRVTFCLYEADISNQPAGVLTAQLTYTKQLVLQASANAGIGAELKSIYFNGEGKFINAGDTLILMDNALVSSGNSITLYDAKASDLPPYSYLTAARLGISAGTSSLTATITNSSSVELAAQGFTFGTTSLAYEFTFVAPQGYLSLIQMSYKYTFTASGTPVISSGLTLGFPQLVPFMIEVIDKHIPIALTAKLTVSYDINNVSSSDDISGSTTPVICKEHYIPYWYNVADLTPVLFDMFTSLFTPLDDIYSKLLISRYKQQKTASKKGRDTKNATSNQSKADSKTEDSTGSK